MKSSTTIIVLLAILLIWPGMIQAPEIAEDIPPKILCALGLMINNPKKEEILRSAIKVVDSAGSFDENRARFCERMELIEAVYYDYPNNVAVMTIEGFTENIIMEYVLFRFEILKEILWAFPKKLSNFFGDKFKSLGAFYIWEYKLLVEVFSHLIDDRKFDHYYYIHDENRTSMDENKEKFSRKYSMSTFIGDIQDYNSFFPMQIRTKLSNGDRIVFVSTPRTNYFFFIQHEQWRFYYHNGHDYSRVFSCEEFAVDATSYDILGAFFIGSTQYLYVNNKDMDQAQGWLILSESAQLCPLRFDPDPMIIEDMFCNRTPIDEETFMEWFIDFIIKWATIIFLLVFNFLVLYYTARKTHFMIHGWQQIKIHESKPGLVPLPTNAQLSDVASRYLVRRQGKQYRDVKREQEDERLIIKEMKRLAKEILYQKPEKKKKKKDQKKNQ